MVTIDTAFSDLLITTLTSGGIAVVRTDTLYGIVAKADNQSAVERVYTVKTRTPTKSPIVLISSLDQLFDEYDEKTMNYLRELWPAKVSIILPSKNGPDWITRGNESIAYRMPDSPELRKLVAKTGPLIAPSANPEGMPPAMNIEDAVNYFDEAVDVYIDGGEVSDDTPSQLYVKNGDELERIR